MKRSTRAAESDVAYALLHSGIVELLENARSGKSDQLNH
jgi:hypothetical protein